ncbi:MAG: phage tail tape measure protein, partial [Pontibacterium sp.]
MTAVTAQTVDIVFRGIDRDYQRTAKRVDRTTDRLRKRFMLVSTAAAGFTVALGAGAANAAKNFQKSMANVAAVTGASREQMKAWNAEVLKIGRNSVAGPQAVAEAFYQVSSGVTDATARMDVLRQSVALAEAGQADLATTTSGLIAAVNAYTPAILSAERASDIYSRTVALGVGSMDEFVSALNPLAGLAASVGLDFAHVGASLSFMTAKGQTASQASTQLKAAITAILKPNQDMAATLQAIGFESGEAALKQVGLAGVLGRLQNEVGGSTDAMAGMLGSVEALQAAVVLNQAGFEDFLGTYLDGIEGATAASRRMQLRSFAAQWSLLQSQIQGVAITIGSRLLPPLTTVGKFVTKSLGWLTDNAGAWLDVALAIGGVTVAVGLATTAFGALGIVLSPVALIMGALAGVAGGLYLAWQHDLGGLRTFTENTFGGIINFIEDTKQRFDNFMALLKGVTPLDERMASATSTVQAGFDVTVVRGDTAEGLSVASGGAFSPTDLLDAAGLTYETAYMLQPGVYRIGSTVEQVLNVDTSIARAAQQYDTAQGPMSFTDALNEAFQIDISPLESSINNISGSINSIDGKTLTSLTTFALIDGNALGIVATNMG